MANSSPRLDTVNSSPGYLQKTPIREIRDTVSLSFLRLPTKPTSTQGRPSCDRTAPATHPSGRRRSHRPSSLLFLLPQTHAVAAFSLAELHPQQAAVASSSPASNPASRGISSASRSLFLSHPLVIITKPPLPSRCPHVTGDFPSGWRRARSTRAVVLLPPGRTTSPWAGLLFPGPSSPSSPSPATSSLPLRPASVAGTLGLVKERPGFVVILLGRRLGSDARALRTAQGGWAQHLLAESSLLSFLNPLCAECDSTGDLDAEKGIREFHLWPSLMVVWPIAMHYSRSCPDAEDGACWDPLGLKRRSGHMDQ
uniref:Uncharacterized protein n=1 Tax=Ananas comosus var. bracteatus TaxID=296719 RepID=A0A6V7NTY7_ANACO|nr:unnamed protein product [Ananas comosus var. bracteatus]